MAKGQQRGIGQVCFQHPIEHLLFVVIPVKVGAFVLITGNHPAAHRTGFRHGTGNITDNPFFVPGTTSHRNRGIGVSGWALADKVDCRGRAAGTGHQTVGAPNHLHAIKEGGVQLTLNVVIYRRHANTVVLEVVDIETT